MHTSNFWHKFSKLSPGVTLKIRWRSPKHNQFNIMSWCYMHENLVKSANRLMRCPASKHFFLLKFGSLSPAMTLKIKTRSPESNQLFILSQWYIHAYFAIIWRPVHEISCKQENVTPTPTATATLTPTPTGSAPKTIYPPPLSGGGIITLGKKKALSM